MKPIQINTRELQIGDTVCSHGTGDIVPRPWSTSIVTQVTDTEVQLWRPYGTTADFVYTGGVIAYVGIETYQIPRDSAGTWTLYNRQELR